MKVAAECPEINRAIEVEYDFGETVSQAIEKFGEELVFKKFQAQCVVDLQGWLRGKLRATDPVRTADDILKDLASWKPTLRKPGKSAAEKLRDLLDKMDKEEVESIMAEYDIE